MARFTKEQRQAIIREFCMRNGREFDPKLFAKEVGENPDHPAREWFEWDDDKAADEYRIWQAREFAKDLKVSFTIEEIGRNGTIRVREVDAPMLVSPVEGRQGGGGYFFTDPNNPDHMAELCRQAATDLERWIRRYEGALVHAGGSVAAMQKQLKVLEVASSTMDEAA